MLRILVLVSFCGIVSANLIADEFTIEHEKVSITCNDQECVGYYLGQIYPNPMSPSYSIPFGIKDSAFVNMWFFSTDGDTLAELCSDTLPAGNYTLYWFRLAEEVAQKSGIYYYEMTSEQLPIAENKESGPIIPSQTRFYCRKYSVFLR